MSRWHSLLISLVFSYAVAVGAQSCPPRPVIVDVLDEHGLPVTNLTTPNFKTSHDGRPLNVSSASFRADPTVRTVILLGDEVLGKIGNSAVLQFLSTASPQAPISLFTFFTSIEQKFNSSAGRQPMVNWLNEPANQPSRKGFSDLAPVLLTIIKAMQPAHPGDAIYVIAGNIDHLFLEPRTKEVSAELPDLARELQTSGIRLFVFVLEKLPRRAWDVIQPDNNMLTIPQTPKGTAAVWDLVKASGGLVLDWYPGTRSVSFGPSYQFDAPTQAAIRESARGFQNAINNFYVLSLDPAGPSSALEDWNLEVVDLQGKKLKGTTVSYPAKIPACGP